MKKLYAWIPVGALLVVGFGGVAVSARHSKDGAAAVAAEAKRVVPSKVENFSKDYEKELMRLRDKPVEGLAQTF